MTQAAGIGTKAQQALKLQQEQGEAGLFARTRQQREAEEARKFQLRQARRRGKAQRSLTSVLFREPFSYGGCEGGKLCYNSGVEKSSLRWIPGRTGRRELRV